MLYRLTRMIMTIALRLFYRRIYATGIETVPDRGPVIMLANHPSSLMDAAILGMLLKRPIHYFTRGDVFRNKFISSILSALNMIPVYDHTGRTTLQDNDESFRKAATVLKSGGLILFFPEGSSHIDRQLRPLKKGAFRLALKAARDLPAHTSLLMIPAGIHYVHPYAAQQDVIVQIGTPMDVKEELEQYQDHESAVMILQLKKKMEKELLKNVVHIQSEEQLSCADKCLEISLNDYSYYTTHWVQATRKLFDEEKNIANAINTTTPFEAAQLKNLVTDYGSALKAHHLKDQQLADNCDVNASTRKKLIAGFPLFILSYCLNALPVLIAKRIADTKVKRVDFYSWIFLTSSVLLYCCWIVLLFFGFLITGIKYAVVITMMTLALGPFTVFYMHLRKAYRAHREYRRLATLNSIGVKELRIQRNRIKEKLQQLMGGIK